MEIFVIVLVILLATAIIDLMVGVANDAVNFLTSAIGARVAPRFVIMIVATLGIIVGVTFSSGLMEVARNGIFNPQMLTFPEVMFIFAATMLTDVLLLDFFNTFGLPTSTTVSLVFELLGAAFAIATIKVIQAGSGGVGDVFAFINTASVFKIIFGIVASVVVAFIVGSLVQYLSRMLFTFDYAKQLRRFGAVWGGFALAALSYFILVKGAKGASFLDESQALWLKENTLLIAGISFLGWTLLMQILVWTMKINVFKPIVLAGTFALAMAFAANDLVNFIGAPLGGLAAFMHVQDVSDPLSQTMESLLEPVRANTWILLLAGAIMAATLWVNKKARTVTATSVNLGRQSDGYERFESIAPARSIVRLVLAIIHFFSVITPDAIKEKVERRFDTSKYKPVPSEDGEVPAFDLLRAAVNLIVAALLISFGTSLKLPLSTTYVTFIVAMATALPDRAWGRDSAVYRVSGVLTVIGGWFFTAFVAATAAAIIATIIYFTELVGLILVALLAGYLLWRSLNVHRKREKEYQEAERRISGSGTNIELALDALKADFSDAVSTTIQIVNRVSEGLMTEDRLALREARDMAKDLHKRGKGMMASIFRTSQMEEKDDSIERKTYAEAMGSLQLLLRSLRNFAGQCYSHIDNNHKGLSGFQQEEFTEIVAAMKKELSRISDSIAQADFGKADKLENKVEDLRNRIRKADKQQLKRSKKEKYTTRTSLLYLEILTECEEIVYHAERLYHHCRECYHPELSGKEKMEKLPETQPDKDSEKSPG
ncbi:MAG: inorganic phosphate transporter [Bacteroidetes bacterium]|nr:inorganic phosphate transporter [Bacteroidota bacterium]